MYTDEPEMSATTLSFINRAMSLSVMQAYKLEKLDRPISNLCHRRGNQAQPVQSWGAIYS